MARERQRRIIIIYYEVVVDLNNQSFAPDSWQKIFETRDKKGAMEFADRFAEVFNDYYEPGEIYVYERERLEYVKDRRYKSGLESSHKEMVKEREKIHFVPLNNK